MAEPLYCHYSNNLDAVWTYFADFIMFYGRNEGTQTLHFKHLQFDVAFQKTKLLYANKL